jgi:Ca2+/Na+ antiporter
MTKLNREITLYGLTMVAIGSCIGSGIFLTPIIFISITFLFVINTLIEKPLHAWAGLIFMIIGSVVFYFFKRRAVTK